MMKNYLMKNDFGFKLEVAGDDQAYLKMPLSTSNGDARAVRTVEVASAVEGYNGPDILLDLDEHGRLLGIEILG